MMDSHRRFFDELDWFDQEHCTRLDDGRYQVGCAFVKPLSTGQLQSLLA